MAIRYEDHKQRIWCINQANISMAAVHIKGEDFSDVWGPLLMAFSTSELFHRYEESWTRPPSATSISFKPTHRAALQDNAKSHDWGGFLGVHDA